MKKFLAILLMITIVAISSVSAQKFSIILEVYVAEKITFEITADGYSVNSNTYNVSYGFYDLDSNVTDAYGAKIFSVVAA